jgi:hypothetical protein
MDSDIMKKFIRSKFDDDEWEDLMLVIHSPQERCDDRQTELRRRYWRLKKAESRMWQRYNRMSNQGFLDYLRRRGLPADKYRHSYWREYVKEGGR